MRVSCVTIDCTDQERQVAFWSEALRYVGRGGCCLPPDGIGPYLEFVPVPEPKTVKNRVHMGFHVADLDREVERLRALGASVAWEEEFPEHVAYRNVVLRDPEGNEFCLGTAARTTVRRLGAETTAVLEEVRALDLPPHLAARVERALEQARFLSAFPLG
jgi:catechol 2,3-dioxygenase-like lactoylglutathione lyase family enzyme